MQSINHSPGGQSYLVESGLFARLFWNQQVNDQRENNSRGSFWQLNRSRRRVCLDHGQSLHSKYSRSITVIFVDRKMDFSKEFLERDSGVGVLTQLTYNYQRSTYHCLAKMAFDILTVLAFKVLTVKGCSMSSATF